MGPEFLIDTNVVIGFFDSTLPPVGRQLVAVSIPAISAITHIELFSSLNISAADRVKLQQFIEVATIYDRLDADIVARTIAVRLQKRIKTPDAIIAATALVHGLTLLTRNTADFKQIAGLTVVDPFAV